MEVYSAPFVVLTDAFTGKRLGGTNDGNKTHKFHGVASKVTALPMSLVFPDDE